MRFRPLRPLGFPIYVARVPSALFVRCPRSLVVTLATLPSTSLIPSAPFARCCAAKARQGLIHWLDHHRDVITVLTE